MNTDLAMQMVTMNSAATQHATQIAVLKKTQEMQQNLMDTLMQTALAAPPPGQGLKVDKQA
ncbi:hypothetical protein ACFSX5_07190 [Devosia albogilva]|uniref:Motility protein n=1 Tax=Devosia albogilva TaxID=429726 RepID=A0ABW5QIU3_9HYPH